MLRWLFLSIVVLALIGAVLAAYLSFTARTPVQMAPVQRGEMREFVDERGKTRLPEEYRIAMPFAGRIEAIGLQAGDRVRVGDVVARLVARDLAEEVAEARAAVERLQASLAENADVTVEESAREQAHLFAESMVSTVAAAEARTLAAKTRLDYSETFLGRMRNVAAAGAETRDDLDRAELSYAERQADYRQDVLTAEALKSLQAATNLMPQIITEYIARKSLAGDVITQQQQEAEARLRLALLRQERAVMPSPIDGVVLERAVRDEQYLPAGTLLLRIGRLEDLEVETDVLSEDVGRIHVGDAAEIYGPALGGAAGSGIAGTVARVYPAGFTKVSSLGVEQQRVTVVVRFDEGARDVLQSRPDLGVDYRVRVRIFVAQKADALIAPRSALFRGPQRDWQVFAVRNGRAQLQRVEVGLLNDEQAEIVSGLSDNELLIIAPESTLQDGTTVKSR